MIQNILTYIILVVVAGTVLYRIYRAFKGKPGSEYNCKCTRCQNASCTDKHGTPCTGQ
ncbi:MAG: FeoB-associated Cys-rich membrane protein [Mangrovibacterium sp.]